MAAPRNARRSVAAVLLAATIVGCVGSPPESDGRASDVDESSGSAAPDAGRRQGGVTDELQRRLEGSALRLRVTGPGLFGPSVGSGFAIGPRTVVTNAHVIAGGNAVELVTWDGRDTTAVDARFSTIADLGRLETAGLVPADPLELAAEDPSPGASVSVVGFPGGGRLTVESEVTVIDFVTGTLFGSSDDIMRLDASTVEPGSSGGPVISTDGEVVGVIFAVEVATGHALAVPVSTLRRHELG